MEGEISLDRSMRTEWGLEFINFPNVVKATLPRHISVVMKGRTVEKIGWFECRKKM